MHWPQGCFNRSIECRNVRALGTIHDRIAEDNEHTGFALYAKLYLFLSRPHMVRNAQSLEVGDLNTWPSVIVGTERSKIDVLPFKPVASPGGLAKVVTATYFFDG